MFRRKKRGAGTLKWKGQRALTRKLEAKYGRSRVFSEAAPLWAIGAKGALLRFDIAIPDQKILVEYQGPQHEDPRAMRYFSRTPAKAFRELKKRDALKRELARANGWVLIEHDAGSQLQMGLF